uniref:Uncharacterized protein n=1 Tax=Solanum tuberosum TaxID=4113 RepID=M1ADR6_SOLTU
MVTLNVTKVSIHHHHQTPNLIPPAINKKKQPSKFKKLGIPGRLNQLLLNF